MRSTWGLIVNHAYDGTHLFQYNTDCTLYGYLLSEDPGIVRTVL